MKKTLVYLTAAVLSLNAIGATSAFADQPQKKLSEMCKGGCKKLVNACGKGCKGCK